jgi:hypothetical protein
MTEDLKDLFTRALADRPPMQSASDMLLRARAADRRRTVYLAAGSGMAAVAAVAAVAVAVPNLAGSDGGTRVGSPPQAPPSATPSEPPASPSPSLPPPDGRADVPLSHGQQLATGLAARLPSGFTSTSLVDYSYAPDTYAPDRVTDGEPAVNALAILRITSRGREGTLVAYITEDRKPDPTGDLCAGDVADRVRTTAESCRVIAVGGTQIRITTATYPAAGRSTSATLFLGNGWLTVTEHLGSLVPSDFTDPLPPDANAAGMAGNGMEGTRNPPLTDLPFTPQDLAEICASPALLAA